MKLEQMKIKKRLRTGFGFVTLLAMLSAVVGIIALIVVSTRYEYALSHYGFSQGDVGKAMVSFAEARSALRAVVGYDDENEIEEQIELHDQKKEVFQTYMEEVEKSVTYREGIQAYNDVLNELGLDIPVCGMVKDDNHRTRGLYYNNVEIPIDRHSEGFKLITRVQDEAHRFAIEYHRSLRSKAQVSSVLDDIEGVGPARRKALMKHFLDINVIRNADVEELMQADGITRQVAGNIYRYFH